jgi:hypothetical protein
MADTAPVQPDPENWSAPRQAPAGFWRRKKRPIRVRCA